MENDVINEEGKRRTGAIVKRYDWQDALVEAQAVGVINNGALMTANKLAHAINWVPGTGGASELRWSDQEAMEVVRLSHGSFYDNVPALEEHGYLEKVGGNWRPAIPVEHESVREAFVTRREDIKRKYVASRERSRSRTRKSGTRTRVPGRRTSESVIRTHTVSINNPVDECSVDNRMTAADAPVGKNHSDRDYVLDSSYSLNRETWLSYNLDRLEEALANSNPLTPKGNPAPVEDSLQPEVATAPLTDNPQSAFPTYEDAMKAHEDWWRPYANQNGGYAWPLLVKKKEEAMAISKQYGREHEGW